MEIILLNLFRSAFILCTIASCASLPRDFERPNRIVGGKPVSEGEFPWQVSLQKKTIFSHLRSHFCGAALIDDKWVVTAAHCARSTNLVKYGVAVVGAWDLRAINREYKIAKVFMLPDFNITTMQNDIALLRLDDSGHEPLYNGTTIKDNTDMRIPLQDKTDLINSTCYISGWGKLSYKGFQNPNILYAAKVDLQSDSICREQMTRSSAIEMFDSQICAGGDSGTDACQGDSGGPLACCTDANPNNRNCKLTGITSWGIGCATPGYPGVYTEVAHFIEWITNIMDTYQ